jgi:hypothetical protein
MFVEFDTDDGEKVEYSIEDGEIFTEEDRESLIEQGEWDKDDIDNEPNWFDFSNFITPKTPKPSTPTKAKSRKVRRKLAAQSRKINRK